MEIQLTHLEFADYNAAMALWKRVDGVRATESEAEFAQFLSRNPGLSVAARTADGMIVGAVLCGHDGRRGYLYHLAVAPEVSRQGIGRQIVSRCLTNLRQHGISRCTIFVIRGNDVGQQFWLKNGFFLREDLQPMAIDLQPES